MPSIKFDLIVDDKGAVAIKTTEEGFKKLDTSAKSVSSSLYEIDQAMEKFRVRAVSTIESVTVLQSAGTRASSIMAETLGNLKMGWIAVAGAISLVGPAYHAAMELATEGAKAQQAEESFRIMARTAEESADRIIASMKEMAAGTVDESDIMQKAFKGMMLGLSGDQMVQIMESARLSARVAGQDVATAYQGITDAIATGMPKALKQYGLITKEEMSMVAQALKAGVENVDLFTIAMANSEIQAAKYGKMMDNASEALQRHKAHLKDVHEEIGKMLLTITGGAILALEEFAKKLDTVEGKARLVRPAGTYGATPYSIKQIGQTDNAVYNAPTYDVTGYKISEEEGARYQRMKIQWAEEDKANWEEQVKRQIETAKNAQATADKAEEWHRIQRDLTGEVKRTSEGMSEWDKRIEDISKKYDDLVIQSKKGKVGLPVDTGWLDNWPDPDARQRAGRLGEGRPGDDEQGPRGRAADAVRDRHAPLEEPERDLRDREGEPDPDPEAPLPDGHRDGKRGPRDGARLPDRPAHPGEGDRRAPDGEHGRPGRDTGGRTRSP